MPPELVPLAVVMALGLGGTLSHPVPSRLNSDGIAAGFSMTYKLLVDPTVLASPPPGSASGSC
jgi:hypothetical protein